MAWIELHQTVWAHHKTMSLGCLLDIRETYAAAHMIRLWTWALDNAADGNLSEMHDRIIARAADWEGDPAVFVAAISEAGYLNPDRTLHDWADYAGRLIERRRQDAERKRVLRTSSGHPTEVRRNRTVPNRNHNPTVPVSQTPDTSEFPDGEQPDICAVGEKDEPTPARVVFDYYRDRIQPAARLFPGDKIKRRLKRFTVDELKAGIDHFAADGWQMENNSRRGADWFFSSDERSERYLNLVPRALSDNGRPKTLAEQRDESLRQRSTNLAEQRRLMRPIHEAERAANELTMEQIEAMYDEAEAREAARKAAAS